MSSHLNQHSQANKYVIKAVERAMTVFDYIATRGKDVSVSEVSVALELNTNMAHRLLQTMTATGYLVQSPETSKYSASLKVLQLGRVALNSVEIRRRAFPYLETLWRDARAANVNLAVLQGREVVVIDRIDSGGVPRTYSTPGKTVPTHASAMGKILLCELSDDKLTELVGTGELPRFTDTTIRTLEKLREELKEVRTNQLSWDLAEQIPNSNCVAAPVRDENARIVAAVSLSAFEMFLSREQLSQAVPRLRETANSISFAMGFNN